MPKLSNLSRTYNILTVRKWFRKVFETRISKNLFLQIFFCKKKISKFAILFLNFLLPFYLAEVQLHRSVDHLAHRILRARMHNACPSQCGQAIRVQRALVVVPEDVPLALVQQQPNEHLEARARLKKKRKKIQIKN